MPLRIERDGRGVVTAWLDNAPKRNAMDDAMLGALAALLEEAAEPGHMRMLVIRGAHGCFCSGRDLGTLAVAPAGRTEPPAARLEPINRLARAFRACAVPVLAFVQGKAAGLGVSLACWSDVAIATEDAALVIPEARAGIAPSITLVSLMEAVGPRQALALCLTGRTLDAAEAVAIGLVQQACRAGEAEAALEATSLALLRGAPGALRLTKFLAREAAGLDPAAALAAAGRTAECSLAGEELAEGLAALRDKRPPAWQRQPAQASAP